MYECLRVCVASPAISLPPSKYVLQYLLIFLSVLLPMFSLCFFNFLSLSCPPCQSHPPPVSVVAWMLQRGQELGSSPFPHLAPRPRPCPTQAGRKDSLLEKARFVPDSAAAGQGSQGIWGSLRAQEQLPRLGHCLQAWPFSLNGMLILYV